MIDWNVKPHKISFQTLPIQKCFVNDEGGFGTWGKVGYREPIAKNMKKTSFFYFVVR